LNHPNALGPSCKFAKDLRKSFASFREMRSPTPATFFIRSLVT
jgi:hypothetical protein